MLSDRVKGFLFLLIMLLVGCESTTVRENDLICMLAICNQVGFDDNEIETELENETDTPSETQNEVRKPEE